MPKIASRAARTHVFALVIVLVIALAAPAYGQSASTARNRREQARARRAQIAAEVNALKATDSQLQAAVATLDKEVRAQTAKVAAARQSVGAAEAALARAEARLATTESEMERLRAAAVHRAVSTYMQPQRDVVATDVQDLNEASRRERLLAVVADQNRDVLDELAATRQDLEIRQREAARARDVASRRNRDVQGRLNALKKAKADKDRLSSALTLRIKEYVEEADLVASQEAALTDIIRRAETRDRASRGGAGDPGAVSSRGLIWPVRGRVTSEYGYRWGRLHAGIDIGAGTGTPIRAATAGEVIFSGVMNGYGNMIIIDHGGGFTTGYAHQSRRAASEGAAVERGDVIGYVGSTGHSTGPHLHFETRVNGSPQNPRRYLP